MPILVVDEGDEISTPAKTHVLCPPPIHLNVSNRAYSGFDYARRGKEVGVVSLAGRLHKFGPSGY